jgi:hypothetical protein
MFRSSRGVQARKGGAGAAEKGEWLYNEGVVSITAEQERQFYDSPATRDS